MLLVSYYLKRSGPPNLFSTARNLALHSRDGIIIESNHQAETGKIDPDDHVEVDGLQARKALIKQVVAAWHEDER